MKRKIIIISIIGLIALGLIGTLIMTATGSSKYDKQIEFGNKYLEEENYEEAILAFQAAIDIDENSIEARIGLAEAYMGIEEYKKAERILEEALEIDETESDIWERLIEIYEITGRPKIEIKELVEEALEKTGDRKFEKWIEEHRPEVANVNIESGSYEEELEINISNIKDKETVFVTVKHNDTDIYELDYQDNLHIDEGETSIEITKTNEYNLTSSISFKYKIVLPNEVNSGNNLNGGYLVKKGDTVYVAHDEKIYEINEKTLEKKVIYDGFSGGRIYSLSIKENFLYYINKGSIFKLDLNTLESYLVITRKNITSYAIGEEEVYYCYSKDGFTYCINKYIVSENIDQEIYSFYGYFPKFVLYRDEIYSKTFESFDSWTPIFKIRTDGTDYKEYDFGFVMEDSFLLTDKGIFYIVKDEEYNMQICFYSFNTESSKALFTIDTRSFNVYKDDLYFFDNNGMLIRYSIKDDSFEDIIQTQSGFQLIITDDFIYFYEREESGLYQLDKKQKEVQKITFEYRGV